MEVSKRYKLTTAGASVALAAALACGAPAAAGASEDQLVKWTSLFGGAGTASSTALGCDTLGQTLRLSDGTFVAVGTYDGAKNNVDEQAHGKSDAALVHYDQDGKKLWHTLAGGSKNDSFASVIETDDGGFIAVGATQSADGDLVGQNKGGNDGLIAKFDANGQLVKAVTFGGSDKDGLTKVTYATDGGFVVSGFSNSHDGDMEATGKTGTDADAILAKYDDDLNLVWVSRTGGTATESGISATERFEDVVPVSAAKAKDVDNLGAEVDVSAGYLAVGYSNAADGDMAGSKGGYDVVVAKFDEQGNREWLRTYGGDGSDKAMAVTRAKATLSSVKDGTPTYDNGFVIAGTTESASGDLGTRDLAGTDDSGAKSAAFALKISATGYVEWSNLVEDSEEVAGEAVLTSTTEGYLLAGTHKVNDGDFSGTDACQKKDAFVAHLSDDGARLGVESFGGNDDDAVEGIAYDGVDNVLVCGTTKSTDGMFKGLAGKADGFVTSLDAEKLQTHAEERSLVPVAAWKAGEDVDSMMAPMLYSDAYVEKTGELYTVTVYFTRATIMGSEVSPTILGDVSYDRGDGTMVDALSDTYDATKRVKSTTIQLTSLENPVLIHIDGSMGDVRLKFDPAAAKQTDVPPYFEPVKVELPNFEYAWKDTLGGTNAEYPADATVLANGNLVTVGQTYSQDGDFDGLQRGPACAYVDVRTPDGTRVSTFELGGMENGYVSYAASVDAAADGGFVLCGGYTSPDGVPAGDFAALAREDGVFGQTDSYVARFDAAGNLVWMGGLSGSGHDQAKQVKALPDGGCVALYETSSHDGDLTELNRGVFNLVVARYAADGTLSWTRPIGGTNLESSDFGLDVLGNGNFVVTGIKSSYNGDFANAEHFGNTFDLFAAEVSASEGTIEWLRTYGGSSNEYLNGVAATSDGGFVMLGSTKSQDGTFTGVTSGYENSYIMKLSASGAVEWVQTLKSSESNEAERVVELDDRYVVLGNSSGTDFDFKDLNKGASDVYVAAFSKTGERLSLDVVGGSSNDYAAQIVALNGYQLTLLAYGNSADGDFDGLAKGDDDALVLTYNWREQAGDTAELAALVAKAQTLSEADYTPETWSIFAAKLAAAHEVLDATYATKVQVNDALVNLQLAMDGLSKAAPAPKPTPDPTPGDSDKPGDGGDADKPADGDGSGDADEPADGDGSGAADVPGGLDKQNASAASASSAAQKGASSAGLATTGDATGLLAFAGGVAAVAAAGVAAIAAVARRRFTR